MRESEKRVPFIRLKSSKLASANLIAFIVAACGGGGGGGSSGSTPIAPSNSIPVAGSDTTVNISEDAIEGPLNLAAPTDSDGDSLTISITAIPTSGSLKKADGTVLANGDALTASELEGLTFTPDANANDGNNAFGSFSYSVSDGKATDSRNVTLSIDAVNDVPTHSITVTELAPTENTTALTTFTATDADGDTLTYSISGGVDQDLFQIDSATGVLTFISAPDYENPLDADADNVYDVQVSATDPSGASTSVSYVVTVNNAAEPETVSGAVVDGLVSGATVKLLDADGNVLATTTTDANGQYTLEATESIGTRIVVDGGTDVFTNESVNITLTAAKNTKFVSALSTLLDSTESLDETLKTNIGLTDDFNHVTDNPLENLQAQKINAKLINIITVGEGLLEAAGVANETGDELIVDQIIKSIKLGKSLTSAADVEEILVNSSKDTVAESKVASLASNISTSLASANEAIEDSVDIIEVTEVQKVVLDDQNSILADVITSVSENTDYVAETTEQIKAEASNVSIPNQKPTSVSINSQSIEENSAGVDVGELSAKDVDSKETFTYALSGTDKDFFELSGTTLKLKSTSSANFETKSSYSVVLTATDSGGETVEGAFLIAIEDINESPTAAVLSSNLLDENKAGVDVGILSATDPDADDTFTYALSGTDQDFFELSGTTLKLKDVSTANFETKSSYDITITTTDAGGLSKAQDLTVNVTDVNDNPTAVALSSSSFNENSSGSDVGILSSTDEDADDTFTYALSGTDKDFFELSGTTLKLKDASSANFETKSSYDITITTTDAGGLSKAQDLTVNVTDVNESPTDLGLSATAVAENTAGVEIGTISTTDPDADDTFTYTLSGDDADSFEVSGSSLKFKDSVSPNFENKSSYAITLTATDSGALAFEEAFTVTITDANDAPSSLSLSASSVAENSSGTDVGILSSTDEDTDDTFTYALSGTDQDFFELSGTTLKLKDASSANFETKSSYDITITTTDAGGLLKAQDLTVNVTDVNESPTDLGLSATAVAENTAGVEIGTISTSDPDADDTFTYTLSGDDADSFEVSGSSLKFKDSVSPNFENKSSYAITLTATDSGALAFEEAFTVTITDANDAPSSLSLSASSVAENSSGTDVGILSSTDEDTDDTFTYALSGTDSDKFELDGTSLKLKDDVSANFESDQNFNVTITTTDESGLEFSKDFVIEVLNVNEAPVLNSNIEAQLVNEDSPLSFTIPDTVFSDPDSDSLTFSVSLEDGSSLPEWLVFDPQTRQFSGTPRNDDVGAYPIKITVTDGEFSVSDILTLTVNNTYDATISGDVIDVSNLLTALGYSGSDPFADGWLVLVQSSSDTLLKIDQTGSGSNYDTTILTLIGITATELTRENFSFNTNPKIFGQAQAAVFHSNLTSGASEVSLAADPVMGSYYSEIPKGISIIVEDLTKIMITGYSGNYSNDTIVMYPVDNVSFNASSKILDQAQEVAFNSNSPSETSHTPLEADPIMGSYYSETLEGTDGDDYFDSGGGNDRVIGGAGNDTLLIHEESSKFTVITLEGLTKITATGYAGNYSYDTVVMYQVETISFHDGDMEVSTILADNMLLGTTSSETWTGTDKDEVVDSAGGDDTLDGGAGTDTLLVFSNKSNFNITTLAGLTKITGGSNAGDYYYDTITSRNVEKVMFADQTVDLDTSNFEITGGTGSTKSYTGTSGDDYFDTAGGNDVVDGGAGTDTLLVFSNKSNFNITTLAGLTKITGGSNAGDYYYDTITSRNVEKVMFADQTVDLDTSNFEITGGTGSTKSYTGTSGDDYFDTAGGNDVVDGGAGTDTLLVFSNKSNFNITTLAGLTKITGGSNAGDYYYDTITSRNVEKVMFADQTVDLDTSNFEITGGTGSTKSYTGTSGDDYFDTAGGNDVVDGGAGTDTLLVFSNKSNFNITTLAGLTKITGGSNAGDYYYDTITSRNVEKVMFADQTVDLDTSNFEITGGTGSTKSYTGTSGDDYFDTAGGNDVVDGGAGTDTLLVFSNKSNFNITTLAGLTKITGGSNAGDYYYDTITSRNVEKVMFADQTVDLDTSNFEITGGTGSTKSYTGTSGDDYFDTAGGNDVVDGGAGTDTLLIFSNRANFSLITLGGVTKIKGGSNAGDYYYDTVTSRNVEKVMFADQTVDLDTSNVNITQGSTRSEIFTGTDGDDYFDTAGGDDFVDGGAGNDTVYFYTDSSNFTITTLAGLTKIKGGSNAGDYYYDTVTLENVEIAAFFDQEITLETSLENTTTGSRYSEVFTGTDGDDYFDTAGGNDVVDGGAGTDTLLIFSNISNFTYITLGGTTILYGGSNAGDYYYDTITLRNVEKVLFADSTWQPTIPDYPIIYGTLDSDTLTGTSGDDYFDGAGGDDVINGGEGQDTLYIVSNSDNFNVTTVDGITSIYGKSSAGSYAYDEIITAGIETVVFIDQTITLDAPNINFIRGTENSEIIDGTDGVDYIHSAGGFDYLDGKGGEDTLLLFGESSSFSEAYTILGLTRIWGYSGDYQSNIIRIKNIEKVSYSDTTIDLETSDITYIHGSYYDDVLDGTSGDDLFDPYGGSDVIYGNGGTDHVIIFGYKGNYEVTIGERGEVALKSNAASGLFAGDTLTLKNIAYIDFLDEVVDIRTYSIIETFESTTLLEGGESLGISFVLSQAPSSNVVLQISSSESKVSFSLSEITFTPDNWDAVQIITVSLEDDDFVERASTEAVNFNISTEDSNFQNKEPESIILNLFDNDSSDDNSISGNVWFDNNNNGIQDDADGSHIGIKVYLDQNRNGEHDNGESYSVTDKSGNYYFGNLTTGEYAVTLDLPSGFATSLPPAGRTYVSSVTSEGTNDLVTTSGFSQNVLPIGSSTTTDHASYQSLINLDDFFSSSAFTKYTGKGYAVAVLDTGIDPDHPHFGADANGDGVGDKIVYQYDFTSNDSDATDNPDDGVSHGTHVASTIASSDSNYPGVAPEADLVILRVLDDSGSGSFIAIEKALQKVIELADKYNIVAVNMSLGDKSQIYQEVLTNTFLSDEMATLAAMGIIVVTSSGNSFANHYSKEGVTFPSAEKYSFSIGNISMDSRPSADKYNPESYGKDKFIASSNRDGDLTTVTAPGHAIPAAADGGGIISLTGTSMSAPVVSGAVVLLQQLAEDLTGSRLSFSQMESLLQNYGEYIIDDEGGGRVTPTELTYPRLDIYKAAEAILKIAKPGQYLVELLQDNNPSNIDFGIVSIGSQSVGGLVGGTSFGDKIEGSSSSDQIFGGLGADEIRGSGGDDSLYGGGGRDTIFGGGGADTLSGGKGRDTFVINSLDEVGDTITDFDITVPSGETEPASSSSLGFVLIVDSSPKYLNLNLAGYENIMGSSGDDILVGSAGDNILDGGTGADTIYSGGGSDTFVLRIGSGGSAITDADTFKDFTDGTDLIGLDNGLTFGDLTIEQGTGSYSSHTVIKAGSEYLAVVENMTASDLTESSFTPINIDESGHLSAPFFFGTNEDGDSLDIDLSNISNQNPNDSSLGLKDLNPEQLPIIEENNKIELNLEEDLSEILLEVKDPEPVSETVDNDIGYFVGTAYEEDELLFAGLEI